MVGNTWNYYAQQALLEHSFSLVYSLFFFFKYVFASIFYFLADLFLFSSNIFVWLLFTYTIKIWARLFKTNDIVS